MKTKAYFPETLRPDFYPQLLGIEHEGRFYKLRLETFHLYEQALPVQSPQEHTHNVFHVVLYLKADNTFKLNGRICKSSRGTLVMVSPGIPHSFSPMQEEKTIYHELTFSYISDKDNLLLNFTEIFRKYYVNVTQSSNMLFHLEDTEIQNIEATFFDLEKALAEYSSPKISLLYIKTGLLFEQLYKKFFSEEITMPCKSHHLQKLQAAHSQIAAKLHKPLSLKTLAAAEGMSPEYFCREFKKEYGIPPLELRNRLRINAAIRLLKYSDHSLKQIAEEFGYSDIYHFSKTFKKRTGISPGKFRNSYKIL